MKRISFCAAAVCLILASVAGTQTADSAALRPADVIDVVVLGQPTLSGDFALEGAPLGARRLDDCYTGFQTPAARIDWDRLSLTVAFACPRPHLQVYTPPQAFCVEPQTCPPDAFNLSAGATPSYEGADIAAPGRPLSLTSRWTWALL